MGIESLDILAEQFARLPGIGRKSAERLAYAVLEYTPEQLEQLDLDEPIDYRAVTRTRKQLARQCLKRLTDALKG